MLEHVKKGHGSRYTCVNLTNADTIEFRMFRGTLKLNTLIATLQLGRPHLRCGDFYVR